MCFTDYVYSYALHTKQSTQRPLSSAAAAYAYVHEIISRKIKSRDRARDKTEKSNSDSIPLLNMPLHVVDPLYV